MYLKWFGGVMIVVACGAVGFSMAAAHRKEERTLRQMTAALDYMECELQFHRTPLPELCRQAAGECVGCLGNVFSALSRELESQISPDVEICMNAALAAVEELPGRTRAALESLGRSLGRFDLEGQLKGLEGVRGACRRELEDLSQNREIRLRSYQTLGLCAGAALAILFL